MIKQEIYLKHAKFFDAVDTVCFECDEGGENTCACDECPVRHTASKFLRIASDYIE